MSPILLWLLLSLGVTITFQQEEVPLKSVSKNVKISLVTLFQLKCDALPYRTKFEDSTATCIVSPKDSSCSDIKIPYAKATTTGKQCRLKLEGSCDGLQIGAKCVNIGSEAANLATASSDCWNKHKSRLHVIHSDQDIKQLLGVLSLESQKAFFIGASVFTNKWENHDNSTVDFFRWIPTEPFFKRQQGVVLWLENSKNVGYRGYMSPAPVNQKFGYISSKAIGSEYIYEKIENDYVKERNDEIDKKKKEKAQKE